MRKLIQVLLAFVIFTMFLVPLNNGYIIKNAEASSIPSSYIKATTGPRGGHWSDYDFPRSWIDANSSTWASLDSTPNGIVLRVSHRLPSGTCTPLIASGGSDDYYRSQAGSPMYGHVLTNVRAGSSTYLLYVELESPTGSKTSVTGEFYASFDANGLFTSEVLIDSMYADYKIIGLGSKPSKSSSYRDYWELAIQYDYGNPDVSSRYRIGAPGQVQIRIAQPLSIQDYLNSPPTTPGTFTYPTSNQLLKGGDTFTVKWGSSYDPDGDTIRYQLQFYNGTTWSIVTSSTTATSYSWTVPKNVTTSNAQFRVRAYDGKEYSSSRTSSNFTIYQNSDPDITLSSPSDNQTIR